MSYRLKISRPSLKLKVVTRIPAQLAGENFITITKANGVYTFDVDYSVLAPGPITDPATAFVAVEDQTAGIYRTVTLASLLTSGLDADLQAVAALTGTGILARTADDTWALRTLTAPAAGITITNPAGVAGNPTLVLANDLAAVEGLASNGMAARTATDTWAVRTITAGASIGVTDGDGVAGNPTIAVTDAELVALAGLTSAADRLPYFTGSGTASLATFTAFARTLVDDADQATMRTTLGLTPGTDVQAFDADLSALAANSTDGFWAHTGAGTGAARTLTAPAAGLTITNPAGIAGNPTFALANDLSALEALGSTGFAARTTTDTWAQRTLTAPAAGLSISNPAGIAGNPTFALANDLAAVEGLASTGIARRTGSDAWSVGTAVANSELATMAAYTIKANATGSSAVPTDVSIPALTQKASPVAADKIMIADSAASDALKYATVSSLASAGSVASLNGQTGALVAYFPPQGRLTLTSATPVLTATTTGNATIYYTPYVGDLVPIYDGTNIVPTVFAELSQALTDATKSPAAATAASVYDLFVWNDGGTIRCTRGPVWTNDTTRSAGTALVRVKGLWLNNASITNGPAASRGTYVGTIRTRAADGTVDWNIGGSASGGTAGFLGVWNAYNRVSLSAASIDTGASYTYTSGTIRQARASAGNQVSVVFGLAEDATQINYSARLGLVAAGAASVFGIGVDSTSTFIGQGVTIAGASGTGLGATNAYAAAPLLGVHVFSANEQSEGTNANNFNVASLNAFSVIARM
jgi:hypothetical protein